MQDAQAGLPCVSSWDGAMATHTHIHTQTTFTNTSADTQIHTDNSDRKTVNALLGDLRFLATR